MTQLQEKIKARDLEQAELDAFADKASDEEARIHGAEQDADAAAAKELDHYGMVHCTCVTRGNAPGVFVNATTGVKSQHSVCKGHPGWMVPRTVQQAQQVTRRNHPAPDAEIEALKARLDQQARLIKAMFDAMPKGQQAKVQAIFKGGADA